MLGGTIFMIMYYTWLPNIRMIIRFYKNIYCICFICCIFHFDKFCIVIVMKRIAFFYDMVISNMLIILRYYIPTTLRMKLEASKKLILNFKAFVVSLKIVLIQSYFKVISWLVVELAFMPKNKNVSVGSKEKFRHRIFSEGLLQKICGFLIYTNP